MIFEVRSFVLEEPSPMNDSLIKGRHTTTRIFGKAVARFSFRYFTLLHRTSSAKKLAMGFISQNALSAAKICGNVNILTR